MRLGNSVSRHQKKSDGAFKLFNDTIKKLSRANTAIDKDITTATKKAEVAMAEAKELDLIKQKNVKFNVQLEKMMDADAI